MQIGVLGPAVAVLDGVEQDLGAAKQWALLAVLALHLRESVNTSTIVEALWGDRPPPSETVTLQGYVYVLPRLRELAARFAIPNVAAALAHTALVTGQSDDAGSGPSDDERVLELAAVPTASAHAVVCVRRGDLATARRIVHTRRERFVADHHDFMSMMRWCYGAELGLTLDDRELAAHADAALAPYAGRSCSAAQIGADGPVDLYRALAAAGLGDLARAADIAGRAAQQCVAWDVPRAGERLAAYRRTYGF